MKKLLLLAALAFLSAGYINAQTIASIPSTIHQTHSTCLRAKQHSKPLYKQFAQSKSTATSLKRAAKAPVVQAINPPYYEPYDTILFTKQTDLENNKIIATTTHSYDQYGLLNHSKIVAPDGTSESRYTYQIGNYNFWTSRLTEIYSTRDPQWKSIYKEERTFNAQKQLTSEKTYGSNQLYLSTEQYYDYSHEIEFDGDTYTGALTLYKKYDSKGNVTEESRYTWFEPAKDYLQTYFKDEWGLEITEFDAVNNQAITNYYTFNSDGTKQLKKQVTDYYGHTQGQLTKEYDRDGALDYVTGQKTVTQLNTPSAGYTTELEYSIDSYDADWQLSKKYVYKGIDADGLPPYGQDAEYWEYGYMFSRPNDGLILLEHQTARWISSSLLEIEKESFQYNEFYTEYQLVVDGEFIDNPYDGTLSISFDKKLQQYIIYSAEDDGEYFTYYNLQNEEVARLRMQYLDLGISNHSSSVYPEDCGAKMEEYKNGSWVPRTADFVFYELDERGDFTFNKQGEVLTQTWYDITPDHPEGELNYTYNYTYLPNEIRIAGIDRDVLSDGQVKEFTTKQWIKHLDNGDYETAALYYDGEKLHEGSYRSIQVNKGLETSYYYGNGKWGEPQYSAPNLTFVDEKTGMVTTIRRNYNAQTGQIENSEKREFTKKEDGYLEEAFYNWNTEYNTWEGTIHHVIYEHLNGYPIKPIRFPKYDDYSKYPAAPSNPFIEVESVTSPDYIDYKWQWTKDAEGKVVGGEWFVIDAHFTMVKPLQPSVYQIDVFNARTYEYKKTVYTVTVNSNQEITHIHKMYTHSVPLSQVKPEEAVSDIDYTYNQLGFITEIKETFYTQDGNTWKPSNNTRARQYEYSPVKIYPVSIDEVEAASAAPITICGRHISAPDNALIQVFDLDGRQVATASGQLTLSAPGLYIIKSMGNTYKAMIK